MESNVVFPAPLCITKKEKKRSYLAPRIAVILPVEQYPLMCLRIIGGKSSLSNWTEDTEVGTVTETTLGEERDSDSHSDRISD